MTQRPAALGRLGVLGAAALFSTGGAAIKACHLSNWQVAGFRSGIAVVFLLAVLPASRRGWTWRTLALALVYASTLISFVAANKLTTSASTIFLQSTAPLYLLLIGPWLLKEKVRRHDLVFMAALAAGMACFFVSTDAVSATAPNPSAGNALALLSGVLWALTIAGLRWSAASGGGAESSAALGNLVAFVVCLPKALPVDRVTTSDILVLVFLGVVQIGLAYVLLTRAVTTVPALETSLLLLLEPVLNPVWAWLVHGERPGGWAWTGGAVILSATAWHAYTVGRARSAG